MPIVQYSNRDLLRDKIVVPAWYRVLIDSVGEWTPSADGKSQNMVLEGTILFNADDGSKAFAEVPIGGAGAWSFNSKAQGFSLGLTKALANQLGIDPEKIDKETRIEFKFFEGKQLDVFIINDTYQGRMKNKVNHQYREPRQVGQVA